MALTAKDSSASGPKSSSVSSEANQQAPLPDCVSAVFQRLMQSAATLNAVSDELGKPVSEIEAALKKLTGGFDVVVASERWISKPVTTGTAISATTKCPAAGVLPFAIWAGCVSDEPTTEEHWLFNDAPRSYRLEAADKIPDLLEALVIASDETAANLKKKIDDVRQVAHTVATVISQERRDDARRD